MNLLVFNLKTDADDAVLGFTTDWLNALAAHCERLIVVTMSMGRLAVADNVVVYSVGRERGYSEARRMVVFYRLVFSILRSHRIHACFAHMMPLFAVMAWPLLRAHQVPIVLWYAHGHVSWLLRVATLLVDRVVTSSHSGFRIPTRKLRVIGQGIDVQRFAPTRGGQQRSEFVLLTVGRISAIKRIEWLIKALALLPPRTPDGLLLVAEFVGGPLTIKDTSYLSELRGLVEELRLEGRVRFKPPVSFRQVDSAYHDADVFVNSSDTDSIDKSVLEAMSCGMPVLTSNAAFCDVIDVEVVPLCVVRKADASALAAGIDSLLSMGSGGRHDLGSRLREIVVRDHSLQALCGRLIGEIQNLRNGRVETETRS